MMQSSTKLVNQALGITLRNACLTLSGRTVLRNVEWQVEPGELWVIGGANGAGKTQLLRLITGERWPDPPMRRICAQSEARQYTSADHTAIELAVIRSRLLWVGGEAVDRYERHQWNFSIQRVVASGVDNSARPLRRLDQTAGKRVREVMVAFGLWPLRRRRLLELSYGQRRWVLLARAFVSSAGLIALDEVFNGLDSDRREALMRLLPLWNKKPVTLILALHPNDVLPATLKTQKAFIHKGRLRVLPVRPPRRTDVSHLGALRDPSHRSSTSVHSVGVNHRRQMANRVNRPPLLRLSNVSVYRNYKPVIAGLNLTLERGEHCLVVGDNGSGKSTLLEAILGTVPVAYGGVIERAGLTKGMALNRWQAHVGYVSPMLQAERFFGASVLDVMVSGLRGSAFIDQPISQRERHRAAAVLDSLNLSVELSAPQLRLSYGERRLLLLARALIAKPKLLLLDEPFTGLDADYRKKLKGLLETLIHTRMSIIMSVHHPGEAIAGMTQCLNINTVSRAHRFSPVGF